MRIATQKISQLKSLVHLECGYYAILLMIILSILGRSLWTLYQPIHDTDYRQIYLLSLQSNYPQTQEMAQRLLEKPTISYGQYFKLVQNYQIEESKVKRLPAVTNH